MPLFVSSPAYGEGARPSARVHLSHERVRELVRVPILAARLARGVALVAWAWVLFFVSTPVSASGFSDWGAVVVAGDWHAHSGAPSEVFDNARRDIAADLVRIGFSPANVVQFSVRPARYPEIEPRNSDGQTI